MITIGTIIDSAWDFYTRHLKNLLLISSQLFIPLVIVILGDILLSAGSEGLQQTGGILLLLNQFIIAPVVTVWVITRIIAYIRAERLKHTITQPFLPAVGVTLLSFLVIVSPLLFLVPGYALIFWYLIKSPEAHVLGAAGVTLAIIGAWTAIVFLLKFMVRYYFSVFAYLVDEKPVTISLRFAKKIVQGRFWHVFWRLIIPKMVFLAGILAIEYILYAGYSNLITYITILNSGTAQQLADLLGSVITTAMAALSVPLLLCADEILYEDLRA